MAFYKLDGVQCANAFTKKMELKMKTGFVIGSIFALLQFFLSIFICKGVYAGESDAGMAAGLYFNLFGYLPLGSLLAFFLPKYDFFPQIDFQNKTSLTSYVPSVLIATLNWFLVGFLVGLVFEKYGKPSAGRR